MEAEGSETGAKESLCDQCRLRKFPDYLPVDWGRPEAPRATKKGLDLESIKIDLIDERLGNIEEILHDLRSSASPKASSTPYYPLPSGSKRRTSFSSSPTNTLDQHEPLPAFEGSSSFTAHSAYASQFLESAVSKGQLQMSTPKMEAALSTLKQIVNLQDSKTHSTKRSDWLPGRRVSSSLRELPLPPVDIVLPILREIKEKPLPWMQGMPFIGADRLIEKCREVFFATEDFSDEAFIIANGGLYFIFAECMFGDKDNKRETYRKCMEIARTNLHYGLANLSLLMPATADTITALALGAIHAIEISKPSFALTLTSTASHLCQTLGYHRVSSMEHDTESVRQDKINLFWTIYSIDKALSLRLGRAATIQDYDISVPLTPYIFGNVEPWSTIYTLWIHHARIQGNVYEQLYSPKALNQPEEQRVIQARKLAAELQWTVMEPHKRDIDREKLSPDDLIAVKADEVTHFALMTMIYRAIPAQDGSSGTFISECIESARSALECHQQSMEMLKERNESQIVLTYLHWTILYSPFVPFIVLFCHVINSSSETDLQRLEEFVASLQPNCALSEAISRLYRLCQVLSNIAKLYLEAKAQTQTQEDQAIGQEFDTYLSALGLAPASVEYGDPRPATARTVPAGSTDIMPGVETQLPHVAPSALRNWYSGNQHMMGLLEEDLSLFDPSVW
ncbi:fungal-specific transcription factor domain protein [Aspergillus terreus]|uniref:Fungal-specific transcription factor domain protein n=1 Tax=Aspergillus terreus TaxID=33178 RepID=A0A5M3YSA6_ASPTE|nr:hypothetical protein ATETN484_0002026000 [Aspergillus terreus]GFF15116.1 fungal-specific transcription factor domain protein [Aspergillus terreus]